MKSGEFNAMVEGVDTHWWYRGRRRIVASELERLPLRPGCDVLDAGCGAGQTLDDLAALGTVHGVHGVDMSADAVEAARSRGHVNVEVSGIETLPHEDASFDLVTCLDVVEHTPDDVATFSELFRVTRPGGHLLVTVPAYQALWSSHDVANEHYRRYRLSTLAAAAEQAGWKLERRTYFNSLLLAPAALVRFVRRSRANSAQRSDLTLTPRWLHPLLELPLRIEAALIRLGLRLPAGLSLLAVFSRPPVASGGHADDHRPLARAVVEVE
ncbi:MAG: class I SAM-dependent methyltransferase [Thermoleophilaceae bacterium]